LRITKVGGIVESLESCVVLLEQLGYDSRNATATQTATYIPSGIPEVAKWIKSGEIDGFLNKLQGHVAVSASTTIEDIFFDILNEFRELKGDALYNNVIKAIKDIVSFSSLAGSVLSTHIAAVGKRWTIMEYEILRESLQQILNGAKLFFTMLGGETKHSRTDENEVIFLFEGEVILVMRR